MIVYFCLSKVFPPRLLQVGGRGWKRVGSAGAVRACVSERELLLHSSDVL